MSLAIATALPKYCIFCFYFILFLILYFFLHHSMNQIKLVQCYHCYAIADHKKPACPYLNMPQRCPRCSQVGHKSWQCENLTFRMHCSGPHPVTALCCPWYREKMESIKIDLINELTSNFHKPQDHTSHNQAPDAMTLLLNSAFTANGSLITFINSLFFASRTMAQSNTASSPYSPYSLTHNSDWEMSSQSQSRSES